MIFLQESRKKWCDKKVSDTKTDLEFTSKAFPTASDKARWDALSPDEQREFIESSEQAG